MSVEQGICQINWISACIHLYYLIMSTRNKQTPVNNLILLYFCFNQQWKSFMFPIWHIKFHQYFKNLFILNPILQEPLFTNLTFFRRFSTGTQYQLFGDSWAQTCLGQMNQKSSVSWDKDRPGSFRSAFKSLIWTNSLPTMSQTCFIMALSLGPLQSGVPGDGVGATATSSTGECSQFASGKISCVSVNSLNAFSLPWGRACELFHLQITGCSNRWQGGIASQWELVRVRSLLFCQRVV